MNSKPDKDICNIDDIAFLSEIIVNFRFWQVRSPTIEIPRQYPAKPRLFLKSTPPISPVPRRF